MNLNIMEKIEKYLYDNEKRDAYVCELAILGKDNEIKATTKKQFHVKKGIYPNRRLIVKLFEKEIKQAIISHKFYNSKVQLSTINRLGTFKRKNIEY